MNCACISGADADYLTTTLSEKMRRARKPHTCIECREPIAPGAKYEDYAGIDDGRLVSYRTCAPCVEIRTHFSDGDGWLWKHIWDDMENCFPDLTAGGPCMEGLSAAAKTKLFAKWRQWKGLDA